jgi:hypothetical protein
MPCTVLLVNPSRMPTPVKAAHGEHVTDARSQPSPASQRGDASQQASPAPPQALSMGSDVPASDVVPPDACGAPPEPAGEPDEPADEPGEPDEPP